MLKFQDAEENDADLLRDTLISSKAYWGYPREQLEKWRANLTFETEYIRNNTVKLIALDSEVIGFFAIVKGNENVLDHLWLLPKVIGKGFGNLAFNQIIVECSLLDIEVFTIVSDPDAQGFYLKKGAQKIGEVFSEAQNRMLPKLVFTVAKNT